LTPNRKLQPPTAQTATGGDKTTGTRQDRWLARAQSAYEQSTSYLDSNYRQAWDDALRAFNGMHPNDSKYNNPAYEKRSKVYRPKIRTVIRKIEAAGAAAFFSNMDVVDITGADQNNKADVASAEVNKALLQYRLTKSIKWFHVVQGGLQDAQTLGVCAAHVHWKYRAPDVKEDTTEDAAEESLAMAETAEDPEYPTQTSVPTDAFASGPDGPQETPSTRQKTPRPGPAKAPLPDGKAKPLIDQPAVDLLPVENLRIDPAADWSDPVNTSPYVIQLIPMYAMDVKANVASGDWLPVTDGEISAARESRPDSTRQARQGKRQDALDDENRAEEYEIVWVQRHIHRDGDDDWDFYTLGDIALLTTPKLLTETCPHLPRGHRPYVLGCSIIEAHKPIPNGSPAIAKGLIDETNEVANQRLDNVKFVLNKKWFIKRGAEVDIAGLMRNVPGGGVTMTDPQTDVREVTWPDVTSSSFEETQRLDGEFNELLGNFSPAQMMQDRALNGPARNMALLNNSAGIMVEYLLRTYVETFVQPILRQLLRLEAHYETDEVIMGLAAKQAQLYQRYGIDAITDDLLDRELTLTVNVGMGATDPQMKVQKFMSAMGAYVNMMKTPVPGLNMMEVGKEIFGHLGYSDGARFFTTEDPQKMLMQQQLQQAGQAVQQLQGKLKEKNDGHLVKLAATRETNQAKFAIAQMQEGEKNKRELATHIRALSESRAQLAQEAVRNLKSGIPQAKVYA
jgi:hypothetical protein